MQTAYEDGDLSVDRANRMLRLLPDWVQAQVTNPRTQYWLAGLTLPG